MNSNRRGEAQSVLTAERQRNQDIQNIAKQLAEVAQLQNDLNAAVVQQEVQVVNIEQQGEQVEENVAKANVEIDGAITSAKAARRKKFWCLGIASKSFTCILREYSNSYSPHRHHHRRRGCCCRGRLAKVRIHNCTSLPGVAFEPLLTCSVKETRSPPPKLQPLQHPPPAESWFELEIRFHSESDLRSYLKTDILFAEYSTTPPTPLLFVFDTADPRLDHQPLSRGRCCLCALAVPDPESSFCTGGCSHRESSGVIELACISFVMLANWISHNREREINQCPICF